MRISWYLFFFFCSFVLTGIFRWFALKVDLVDIPTSRSSHSKPTPRGGGIAVVITFILGSWTLFVFGEIPAKEFYGVVLSSGIIALVGLYDDYHSLPPLSRLAVHLVVSSLAVFFLFSSPVVPLFSMKIHLEWVGMVMLVVSLTWMLNLYNFMDGIDGIAGVEAITTSLSVLFLLWIHGRESCYMAWLGILSVSVGGFLIWNWPPAKIFMGDACSGFLGYIMGVFALLTSSDKGVNVWTWGILLGIFIIDATLTLVQRIINRENVTQAHRCHAYQILARRFGSHKKITMTVCAVNLCWLLPFALLSVFFENYSILFLIFSYAPILLFFWRTGAGKKNI